MARFFNPFKVREHGNLEFWISNLVILLSTVLGVFLAAQAGFRTALEFEVARSERDGYYMRRALLDEFRDNLDQADKYADFVMNRDGWRFKGNADAYKMQDFVWTAMKTQDVTFQLPPAILTAVRRYYDTAASLAQALAQGQGTAMDAAKQLVEETKKMRDTAVPALEQDVAALRTRLTERGFKVD